VLSRGDLDYVRHRDHLLRARGIVTGEERFLEVVVGVRRRSHRTELQKGWRIRNHVRKVSARLAINGLGYVLTFGAYWLEPHREPLRPVETEIRIPWWTAPVRGRE
jgi:hypothetical protein